MCIYIYIYIYIYIIQHTYVQIERSINTAKVSSSNDDFTISTMQQTTMEGETMFD